MKTTAKRRGQACSWNGLGSGKWTGLRRRLPIGSNDDAPDAAEEGDREEEEEGKEGERGGPHLLSELCGILCAFPDCGKSSSLEVRYELVPLIESSPRMRDACARLVRTTGEEIDMHNMHTVCY